MTDPREIPYLLQLLDDDSSDVQNRVIKELASFGPILQNELKKISHPLNSIQVKHLQRILYAQQRQWLKQAWPRWQHLADDKSRLERALSILADFLNASLDLDPLGNISGVLGHQLDALAESYRKRFQINDEMQLAQFLFKEKGLQGNDADYYNPQNSNLLYVIENKKGIPISLTAIYMLVGSRLGLSIEGCHFPGHFLARIDLDGKKTFIDCFNYGQIIKQEDIVRLREDVFDGVESILKEKADVETIIRRFLANLIRSYQIREDDSNAELIMDLFSDLDMHLEDRKLSDLTPEEIINSAEPFFYTGELVRHKRYDYRGIIVDFDLSCSATDSWYYGNQTQPNRHQPWYHILVDGSDQVTYVAESNLRHDKSEREVNHPLLSYFFTLSSSGQYVRNNVPWPDADF